ncbi:MAG: ASKHA domain-containing protein [Bacillota bacterium]
MADRDKKVLILRERKAAEIVPDPVTKKIYLELAGPGLSDNRADVDRVVRELNRQLGQVSVDFRMMNQISLTLRNSGWRVTATVGIGDCGWRLLKLEPGDTTAAHYGLAVDIGTTTVVAYLIDMNTGGVLDVEADYNGQVVYGEDILSRIFHAREKDGPELLQNAIIETLNSLTNKIAERNQLIAGRDITAVSIGANTTMVHLLLGLNPENICVAPYIPVVNSPGIIEAGALGLGVCYRAPVYLFPSVGSYLGGDVIAGVLASGMHKSDELSLLVDIGTNGEFVLGNSQWMVACAGAAGPALEGGVAASGMRAAPGAIFKIEIDEQKATLKYYTIGGKKPLGICGSGLVDGIAELFLSGLIDRGGKFLGGIKQFVVVPAGQSGTGREIVITQTDINNFMRTKGAVNAALELLLESVGYGIGDIERFYAAGAFGHHINVESAVTLGLYPDLDRERIIKIGNSSGEGARMALMSRECLKKSSAIASNITYFELNANQEFMNKFISSKFIPHTNMDFFPTVKRRLAERKGLAGKNIISVQS